MTNKYFGGKVTKNTKPTELDNEVIELLNSMSKKVDEDMEALNAPYALKDIFTRLERLNKYIDETMPWALAKDEAQLPRLNDVLYTILEGIKMCAEQLEAFIPRTSNEIFRQLKTSEDSLDSKFGNTDSFEVIDKPEILFQRIDEEALKEKLKALEEPVIEHKAEIAFDDFDKVEMIVGEVKECSKHPDADKILVFKIDFGGEVRQILSGVAAYYKPEELVGRKVIAVTNLKPRKIRGLESNGMLLSAVHKDGDKEALELLTSNLEIGSKVC